MMHRLELGTWNRQTDRRTDRGLGLLLRRHLTGAKQRQLDSKYVPLATFTTLSQLDKRKQVSAVVDETA